MVVSFRVAQQFVLAGQSGAESGGAQSEGLFLGGLFGLVLGCLAILTNRFMGELILGIFGGDGEDSLPGLRRNANGSFPAFWGLGLAMVAFGVGLMIYAVAQGGR